MAGEGGYAPFVSSDGEWVGFLASGGTTLQRVSIFGGPPVTLTESPNQIFGASWGADDQIVFGTLGAGLFRVSGGGGEPEALTTLDTEQGDGYHAWPFIIPGRDAVVFVIGTGLPLNTGQLAVLDLNTGAITRLGLAGVSPHYVSTGHLVYAAADGSVRAVPFDATSLEVTGNPVPLVEGVMVKTSGAAAFAISNNGRLVYALGAGAGAVRTMVWVDRDGREESLAAAPRNYQTLQLSPGGTHVALAIGESTGTDIHIYDIARDNTTRLTFSAEGECCPLWTPDGQGVVFQSSRDGAANLYLKAADGTGQAERLSESNDSQVAYDWSADGQTLVVISGDDVYTLSLEGDRELRGLLETEFVEERLSLSPDGRWITHESNESGQDEIYVRPFPDLNGGRDKVSTDGGDEPLWSPDGTEIFYRRGDAMMSVPVNTDAGFQAGNPEILFQGTYGGGAQRRYDVTPGGRRFLMFKEGIGQTTEDAAPPQITVVLNWFEQLKERVPVP